jgi:quaternary ammonium compound-resistance protein SugE
MAWIYGVRTIPIGTAYAVWTGIGAMGTALYGIARLGEPISAARTGIAGLKVLSPH